MQKVVDVVDPDFLALALWRQRIASFRSEDGEHVVPLTGRTFKDFLEKNDHVMVHFVSS